VNSSKRSRLICKIILKHRSAGWTSCLVYVKYSAKVVVLRNSRNRDKAGRVGINSSDGVSDVVNPLKTRRRLLDLTF